MLLLSEVSPESCIKQITFQGLVAYKLVAYKRKCKSSSES